MLHVSPWSRNMNPMTYRLKNQLVQSLTPNKQPNSVRLNNLSLYQHSKAQHYKQYSSIHDDLKQFNNASSQTDLPAIEIEDLIHQQQEQSARKYQHAMLQTKNHYHQSTIISLLQTINFKPEKSQIMNKAQQLKKIIVQNKNRTITVIVVNNASQFISHLMNSKYFESTPGNFFTTYHHPSFFITQITISNTQSANTVHSYQDLLQVTKKNRIYDASLNRLLYDQSQQFIHYCPDIVIATIGNLQEELSNRHRDRSFLIKSTEQISKENSILNKKRTKFKLKELY